MKIFVKVKPGAKADGVERVGEGRFAVAVKEPARDGKANEAVLRKIAEHFGAAPSSVKMLKGFQSKEKVLEIL